MPRKPKQAEIVLSEDAITGPADKLKAMIAELVVKQVDAAMAQRQPKEVTQEAKRQQSMFDQRKHALYFAKWGCEICGTKKARHECNGRCQRCHLWRYQRYEQLRREFNQEHPAGEAARQIERMTARIDNAKRILGTEE